MDAVGDSWQDKEGWVQNLKDSQNSISNLLQSFVRIKQTWLKDSTIKVTVYTVHNYVPQRNILCHRLSIHQA